MASDNKECVDLIVKNGKVVTFNPDNEIIEQGAIAISGQKIQDIGPSEIIMAGYRANQTIDASRHLVMPGLINAHTHSPMTLYRGLADDISVIPWLSEMSKASAKVIRPDVVQVTAKLGYIEKLRGGTTTALDMYYYPEVLAKAAQWVGIRLITGPVFVSSQKMGNLDNDKRVQKGEEFIHKYRNDPLITACVSPHSTFDVPPEALEKALDLAKKFDVLINIHTSETQAEVEHVLNQYGMSPIQFLNNLGLLSQRAVLAHCVYVTDDDINLIAKQGATVAHCPISNLKLADGVAPVNKMLDAGVNVVLGTDGPGSSNDLNMWAVIRLAAILHKGIQLDPTILPAMKVMKMVTIEAANSLGLADRIGSLEKGKIADIILIDLDRPHLVPMYDVYSHMVYAIGRDDISTVIVNGKVIIRKGRYENIQIHPILEEVREIASIVQE